MKMEEARGPATETNEVEVQIVDHGSRQMSVVAWVCCVPCYWLRNNNGVHRAALSAATLLVTSLLVASPFLFLISAAPGGDPIRDCDVDEDAPDCPPPKQEPQSCTRAACRTAAVQLREPLLWSVQPCSDFLSFACGRREALFNPQTVADRTIQELLAFNTSSGPFRHLGHFYNTCLRTSKREVEKAAISHLEELGGYLPPSSVGPRSVTPLLAVLLSFGSAPLLDVYWGLPQMLRDRRPILYVAPPDYSRQVIQGAVRILEPNLPPLSQIAQSSSTMDWDNVNIILRELLPAALPPMLLASETRTIHDLLRQLDQLWTSDQSGSELHSLNTLQEMLPMFQWSVLLSSLAISDRDVIIVNSPDYFIQLNSILRSYPTRIIHNALLVIQGAHWLNLLTRSSTEKASFCSSLTTWTMPKSCSALYVSSFDNSDVQNRIDRAQNLFDHLKSAFTDRVPDVETELNTLRLVIDSPKSWNMKDKEDIEYDMDLFELYLQISRSSRRISKNLFIQYAASGNQTQIQENVAYPFIATAFYERNLNSIVLPMSIIMSIMFHKDVPTYMHYATIGNTVAEQIYKALEEFAITTNSEGFRLPPCIDAEISVRVQNVFDQQNARSHLVALALAKPQHDDTSDIVMPGISLTPEQLYYVAAAQARCATLPPSALSNTAFALERKFSEIWKCKSQPRPDRFKRCPGW